MPEFAGEVPAARCPLPVLSAEGRTTSGVRLSAACQLCHQHCCSLSQHGFLAGFWPFHLVVLSSVFPFQISLALFPVCWIAARENDTIRLVSYVPAIPGICMGQRNCLLEPKDEADKWPVWENIEHSTK